MPRYESWMQVAGYFDGDGTIAISDTSNQPYNLGLSLQFVDQSRGQISMLRNFVRSKGVETSRILKTSKGTASMISIGRYDAVVKTLRAMLPFLYKKANEARTALSYYEGRTTGNQLYAAFQREVEAARRERHPRKVVIDVPYRRPVGTRLLKMRRRERLWRAIEMVRAKVSKQDYDNIRKERLGHGTRICDLTRQYPKYSKETIRRILGRDRGYVLVVGVGRVVSSPPV